MVAVGLPAQLQAAIPSLRWPLDPSSCPPLHLQSLENLKSLREKTLSANSPLRDVLLDLPSTLDSVLPQGDDEDHKYFGLISMSLLLLGNGYTDECHNLITPLSWPEDIHFAHGPSIYSQVSPAVQSYATYVHSLVHRREAFNTGEFGMLGFANANYWSNAFARSRGHNDLPHRELLQYVVTLAQSFPSCEPVQSWCQQHSMIASSINEEPPYFENRAVHQLCAKVLQQSSSDDDSDLRRFAELVSEGEVRILLGHALQRAGYDVDKTKIVEQRQM